MKKNRQEKIIELVENNDIETQQQLTDMLIASGYRVTQATISRDIRSLRLTKVTSRDGRQVYRASRDENPFLQERYIQVLKNGFVSMDAAGNLLVLKTVTGMAMAVAAALDDLKLPEIVGCVAGDDTIMAACKTEQDVKTVMEKIGEAVRA